MMDLIRPEETAIRLGVTPGTLAVWRATKRYPLRYVKIGRKVCYRVADIEKFIQLRTMDGVVEPAKRRRHRSRQAA
jgi:hypothetical protein